MHIEGHSEIHQPVCTREQSRQDAEAAVGELREAANVLSLHYRGVVNSSTPSEQQDRNLVVTPSLAVKTAEIVVQGPQECEQRRSVRRGNCYPCQFRVGRPDLAGPRELAQVDDLVYSLFEGGIETVVHIRI